MNDKNFIEVQKEIKTKDLRHMQHNKLIKSLAAINFNTQMVSV